METCTAILICEGPTDVAVVGACLEKKYGATTEELKTSNQRNYYSKAVISCVRISLFVPEPSSLPQAEKALVLMANNTATRGLNPSLRHLCLVRDQNGHNLADLATKFQEFVGEVGKPETQPVDAGNGIFRLPNLSLRQILMGDSAFGENDKNAVDDHVVDCLCQTGRADIGNLTAAFEEITGNPPNSKQFVTLAMALDSHLGKPTRYYNNVIQNTSEAWITEFVARIGLDDLIQAAIADSYIMPSQG